MRCRLSGAKAITALVVIIGALAYGLPGPRHADAALALPSTCGNTNSSPIAVGTPVGTAFECDYVTTAAVVGSASSPATLSLAVTAPLNVFFTGPGVLGTLPNGCTAAAVVT